MQKKINTLFKTKNVTSLFSTEIKYFNIKNKDH